MRITVMVNLPIEYSDKPVTPISGLALMKRFVDQLGMLPLPSGGSNRAYDPVHIIEGYWLGIWTGASRYIHCDWLRQDATLAAIFGYEPLPSQSTYSRFFGKFSQARNTAVFPPSQRWFFEQIHLGAVTVDFDSTVITREGSQEGSAKGYNPNRKGRNSYHPLIAFVSQTRMVANAWLRPGNTAACSNCVEFMRETFDEVLAGLKVVLVRADSGFLHQRHLERTGGAPPQLHRCGQGICQPQERGLRPVGLGGNLSGHRGQGVASPACRFQGQSAALPRRAQGDRPPAAGKVLFDDLPDYRFCLYVTNLDLPLDQVWNIYNSRADCENRIRELKAGLRARTRSACKTFGPRKPRTASSWWPTT